MSQAITDALAASGVGHVVALSTVAAGQPGATGPAAGLRELEGRLSGLGDRNVLVLRSPFYMENLLAALPLIKAKGINVTEVDKASFENAVLEKKPVESLGYRQADWDAIKAIQPAS